MENRRIGVFVSALMMVILSTSTLAMAMSRGKKSLPVEDATLTFAPEVPPPVVRKHPAIVRATLQGGMKEMPISDEISYKFWTFNGHVPGPFIRARVGDTLEVHVTNSDDSGMPHNVDFHAVTGPGGGATVTTAVQGEEKVAWFKLLHPASSSITVPPHPSWTTSPMGCTG